jgi:DNA repair exonuclease SbcCD ATPase subunit
MPETSLLDESIAKLEALKRKRTSLKARITRIQNFVSNFQSNDNDVSPLETRKTFIEQIFKEYDEVQTEIESLDLSSEAIETQTQDRDEIDLKYLDVLSSIQTKIRQTTPPPHTAATANPNGSCSSANSHCSNRDQSIKLNLPTLNLKSFTGCYKEWLSFQNSFKSIIEDENNMLNNCQRFQYLRSCLSGEALRAVESLTVSSENYNVAWDILKKRFCNKRLIVHDHIIAITKAP